MDPIRFVLPDWKAWLNESAPLPAANPAEYLLHLAAHEWMLGAALDINDKDDFESLKHIKVDPFAHQVDDAILFFRRLAPRGLIADDVGLGKTITAGLIAIELLHRGRIESILVVCPKGIAEQWREELLSKFSVDARVAFGGEFADLPDAPFWITSYATARNKMPLIRARKFDLVILDEAHALKNLYSQIPPQVALRFRELMQADGARFVLMLTATPIQNRLWDIYSLLEILRTPLPNPLGRPDEFSNRFIADPDTARRIRSGREAEFRQRLAETTIRKRRADTGLAFPDRHVKNARISPLPGEREYMESALNVILKFPKLTQYVYAAGLMSSPWAAAASFEKRAQEPLEPPVPRRTLLQLAAAGREIKESAKTREVVELARATAKQGKAGRLIVFTRRIETLSHLAHVLEASGFKDQIAVMRGGQHLANQLAIRDFMSDPPARPILLSTDVGAQGLNLQAGNIVVNYDLPWNPMLIEQRIGRIQRLGQKAKHVVVHNLILKGTIEDHIVIRVMEKLRLFEQAIGEMEELLELCDFSDDEDEATSLSARIMELVRKAAEQKDIEDDLQRMEASRKAAEERMREMREATEKALVSIRPPDSGHKLDGLERPKPRMSLKDLILGCLRRAGAQVRELEDGRLVTRSPQGEEIELRFERAGFGPAGIQNPQWRVVLPGTRAFDHIIKEVREKARHYVFDGSKCGLERVEEALRSHLEPHGMVVESLSLRSQDAAVAVRAALKCTASVRGDRYEYIAEVERADDGVVSFLDLDVVPPGPAGNPLPRCDETAVRAMAAPLRRLNEDVEGTLGGSEAVRKFCEFYAERRAEEITRLAKYAKESGQRDFGSSEETVAQAARKNPAIRTALDAVRARFTSEVQLEPVGLMGVHYMRAKIDASIRNREQKIAHSIRLLAVPLTGVLLDGIPMSDALAGGGQGWACPGGHVVAESEYVRCAGDGCTAGACSSCLDTLAGKKRLVRCNACSQPLCAEHRYECKGCGKELCVDHVQSLATGGVACGSCAVAMSDGGQALDVEAVVSAASGKRGLKREVAASDLSGRLAFPDELVTCEQSGRRVLPDEIGRCSITGKKVARDLLGVSAVSGKFGLRELMKQSAVSERLCLPDEARLCDETGAVILPDEAGYCSVTNRHARRDLLETDAISGKPVLRRLLLKSAASGRYARPEYIRKSERSGELALASELVRCEICGRELLPGELHTCAETGRKGCQEHFVKCEASGEDILSDVPVCCEVTGKRVRPSLMAVCPETGKRALKALFQTCEATGVQLLPDGLASCAISGKRVRRSLLEACEATGKLALPSELATCGVTGKRVVPDVLVECPETKVHMLPDAAEACEETGALCVPAAVAACAVTGKRARRSLLARDDLSDGLVLERLLETCQLTGVRTVASNLGTSSVTGKRVLASKLVACPESGRPALAEEFIRCSVTGQAVHPDLLVGCAETGLQLLRRVAERCAVTGVLLAPDGAGTCHATGSRVRQSLLGLDEVTGKTVQAKLLQTCEHTGRKAVAENLVRSAVSGKRVLVEIAAQCEDTSAWTLPHELERCEVTGKAVLPDRLERCQKSNRNVLKSLLQSCEVTGRRVLPEHLKRCAISGQTVVADLLVPSEASGLLGQRELMATCEFSNARVLPAETILSEISGRRLVVNRARSCACCARQAEISELSECAVCGGMACKADMAVGICRACAGALSKRMGRSLGRPGILKVRESLPWARTGWAVPTRDHLHVLMESGAFSWPRKRALVTYSVRNGAIGDLLVERPIGDWRALRRRIENAIAIMGLGGVDAGNGARNGV